MKRILARALVLVNWRGVFYEHYELDEHVTALEGVNGAGKTTVLIGAYMVLLPDLGRLRFTNLGEHAATGSDRGIYGRLGDDGSPSYAVLDIDLPRGGRLLAGVQLQRRAQPSLDLRPFIITDLPRTSALEDVLLITRDAVQIVPDLPQIREAAALHGAQLKAFDGPKDYLAALFERGVTPMRLGTEDERAKFNDMLRTSMVGGISEALRSGLRDFLLREDATLGETLRRVRDNLGACRRTRRQVSEAVDLERDIESVYRAGAGMIAAAVQATREREREARDRLDLARRRSQEASEQMEALTAALAAARAQQASAQAARSEAEVAAARAGEVLRQTRSAHALHQRILILEKEAEARRARAAVARTAAEQAAARVAEAERRLQGALDDHDRAARGLAELRSGLAELERRAWLHGEVSTRLARQAGPLHGRDEVDAARLRAEAERDAHDATIIACERGLETAEARRREHETVLAALRRLEPQAATYDDALTILASLRDDEHRAAAAPQVAETLREARARAARQADLRRDAARWSTPDHPLTSSDDARHAFNEADHRVIALHDELTAARQALTRSEACTASLRADLGVLEAADAERRALLAALRSLSDVHRRPLETRAEVDALRRDLVERRVRLDREREETEGQRDAFLQEAARLEDAGGAFPSTLAAAAEAVDGDLLAAHFEEVPIEDAARVQATLGPLAEAVLVDDVAAAAQRLCALETRPDTVWLVARDRVPTLDDTGTWLGDSVLVAADGGGRLTRQPAAPTIGRRARAERIASLRAEAERAAAEVLERAAEVRACAAALAEVERVSPHLGALEADDPAPRLEALRGALERASDDEAEARARLASAADALPTTAARRTALAEMLPHAHLLDPPDGALEVTRLEDELRGARAAGERLARCAADRRVVDERRDALRHPPPAEVDLAELRSRMAAAAEQRDAAAGRVRDLAFCGENLQERRGRRPARAEGAGAHARRAGAAGPRRGGAGAVGVRRGESRRARGTGCGGAGRGRSRRGRACAGRGARATGRHGL